MNWEAVGTLAELLGAIGVILSLLYLSVQLRQSNRLARRSAAHAVLDSRTEFNRFLAANEDLSALFWRGLEQPEALSLTEWRRFRTLFSTLARQYECVFIDQAEGLLPEGIKQSQERSMQRWFALPGARRFFAELGEDFDPAFIEHIASHHGADG